MKQFIRLSALAALLVGTLYGGLHPSDVRKLDAQITPVQLDGPPCIPHMYCPL